MKASDMFDLYERTSIITSYNIVAQKYILIFINYLGIRIVHIKIKIVYIVNLSTEATRMTYHVYNDN